MTDPSMTPLTGNSVISITVSSQKMTSERRRFGQDKRGKRCRPIEHDLQTLFLEDLKCSKDAIIGVFLAEKRHQEFFFFFPKKRMHYILASKPPFVNTGLEARVQQSMLLRTVPVGAGGQR